MKAQAPLANSVVLRTRRSWLFVGAIAWGIFAFGPLVHFGVSAPLIFVYLGVLALALFAWLRWPIRRRVDLAVEGGWLLVDGLRRIRCRAVRFTVPVTDEGRRWLRLNRWGPNIDLGLDDEQAARLLAALSGGHRPPAARFLMAQAGWTWPEVLSVVATSTALFMLLFCDGSDRAFVLGFSTLFSGLALSLVSFVFAEVGTDGVSIRGIRSDFVPFHSIESISHHGPRIAMKLRGSRSIRLRSANASAFVEKVAQGIAESSGPTSEAATHALRRGSRTVHEWLGGLVHDGPEREEGYRRPVLPSEVLWRIADDPATDQTERAGAALLLRASAGEQGRAKLGALADACASPRLRVALQAIANPSDDDRAVILALEGLVDLNGPVQRDPGAPDEMEGLRQLGRCLVAQNAIRVAPSPAQSHLPVESDHERIVEDVGQTDDDAHGSRVRR